MKMSEAAGKHQQNLFLVTAAKVTAAPIHKGVVATSSGQRMAPVMMAGGKGKKHASKFGVNKKEKSYHDMNRYKASQK